MDNEISWKVKYDELEKGNNMLRRWKMEAVELLTKINSYAHKHLEIKLGQCAVDLVLSMAKQRDELKERCEKMEAALLSAQRLKTLWAFSEPVSPEHLNKAVALEYMANKIDEALAFKHEGINEKEGEDEFPSTFNLSIDEKKKLLANKIESRMKDVGLYRQEFADLMAVQPSTITRWLSGEHNFEIKTLFEIEKQLNIKLFNL
jgi:DNA-binding transcriptional regulator YiaG